MFEQKIAELSYLILPGSIILLSLIAGIVVNKVIFSKLHRQIEQLSGTFYQIFAKALKGMPIIWCLTLGLYGALNSITINKGLHSVLENSLLALILFSTTMVIARTVVGLVNAYAQKTEGILPSTSILANLAELSVYIVGMLIILQSFGISIAPILTALGVGGLAVALALQETLSNLFSGLHILLSKQIKLGDYVRLSTGEEGNVVDITWRNTTIRALSNNMIVVPNQKIASAILTNYYMPDKELSVTVPVGVSYDSDLDHVEKVTLEVARQVMQEIEGSISNFEPTVRFHTLGDFSINCNVSLRTSEFSNQYLLRHEFIKRLIVRYRQEGIEIPFPVRTVQLKEAP